jgi:hypothetical protein
MATQCYVYSAKTYFDAGRMQPQLGRTKPLHYMSLDTNFHRQFYPLPRFLWRHMATVILQKPMLLEKPNLFITLS